MVSVYATDMDVEKTDMSKPPKTLVGLGVLGRKTFDLVPVKGVRCSWDLENWGACCLTKIHHLRYLHAIVASKIQPSYSLRTLSRTAQPSILKKLSHPLG